MLFAFDLDGTLIVGNEDIHPANVIVLEQAHAQGHKIAIVTGRPMLYTKHLTKWSFIDYLCVNNGSIIYDLRTGEFCFENYIPKAAARKLLDYARKNRMNYFLDCLSQISFVKYDANNANLATATQEFKDAMKAIEDKNHCIQVGLHYELLRPISWKIYREAKATFPDLSITISNQVFLDFVPHGINKFVAVALIAQREGIANSDCYAFGDSLNDYEMIKNVGHGFAMGNATLELKSVAKRIIGSNESCAIGETIKSILKI